MRLERVTEAGGQVVIEDGDPVESYIAQLERLIKRPALGNTAPFVKVKLAADVRRSLDALSTASIYAETLGEQFARLVRANDRKRAAWVERQRGRGAL